MNVTFISQCHHKAVARTARVLDAYAVRIGDRTWKTSLSSQGLEIVRHELRRQASRNSAVACWLEHGSRPPQLHWTVGRRTAFAETGVVPVNQTSRFGKFLLAEKSGSRKRIRSARADLNALPLRIACLLAKCAGLAHDLGKFGWFQDLLAQSTEPGSKPQQDPIRHEWISIQIWMHAFGIAESVDWDLPWSLPLVRWSDPHGPGATLRDGVKSAHSALTYLILTHHRLAGPAVQPRGKAVSDGRPSDATYIRDIHRWGSYRDERSVHAATHDRKGPLSRPQLGTLRMIAGARRRLDKLEGQLPPFVDEDGRAVFWRAVTELARPALILADHAVSGIDLTRHREHGNALLKSNQRERLTDSSVGRAAFANTRAQPGRARVLNQQLDWHLQQVGRVAGINIPRMLGIKANGLPQHVVEDLARASTNPRFRWQTTSAQVLREAQRSRRLPTLALLVAGTGSGKTRMNAMIVEALREGQDVRFVCAMNLRTLTLQTRDAYTRQLSMSSQELACVIGCRVTVRLHDAGGKEASTSAREQIEADNHSDDVDEDGNPPEQAFAAEGETDWCPPWLAKFLDESPSMRAVVSAPVVVCTSDFIVAAGDPSQKQAHALTGIRLMESDLILDEIDSYDSRAMVAICRLVTRAAMFGRHVVASSATLAVPVAAALHEAYMLGIRMGCAAGLLDSTDWRQAVVDDAKGARIGTCPGRDEFMRWYEGEVQSSLATFGRRRLRPATLVAISNQAGQQPEIAFRTVIHRQCYQMHSWHASLVAIDGRDHKVSVGLVRVANISVARRLSRWLAAEPPSAGISHHVVCYHSRLPRIHRHLLEKNLDQLLKLDVHVAERGAHSARQAAFEGSSEGMALLRKNASAGVLETMIIVVATPVEEIGRDHDFDYAIIEPSSTQSIVQAAGRVNRHRLLEQDFPNVAILQFNHRALSLGEPSQPPKPVFVWPGNETASIRFESDMGIALDWIRLDEAGQIDARLRFDADHAFSASDDHAIQAMIDRYLSPFTRSANIGWTSLMPYKDAPLRDDKLNEVWSRLDDGTFVREEIVGRGRRRLVPRDDLVETTTPPSRAWLSWDFDHLRELASSLDISTVDAFVVEAPPLTESQRMEVDPASGFCAVKA